MRKQVDVARLLRWALVVPVASGCSDIFGPDGAPRRLDGLPRELSVAEQEIISASNDFTFRLLEQVLADPELGSGNVFLSPFSVSMALGMALNGADGETFDSMRVTLGFGGLDRTAINESYRDLTELLLGLDARTELRIANSVWAAEGVSFEDAFFDAARTYFDAEVRALDFGSPGAPDVINEWVSDATRGRIGEIVQDIPDSTIMYLIDAVYFKGQWSDRFDRGDTEPAPFYLEGAEPVDVETMHGTVNAGLFYGADDVAGVELPYGNQAFTMVAVTPRGGATLEDVLDGLDEERWRGWTDAISYDELRVTLPRWEMEYEAGLNAPLRRMGMGVAFTDSADFSRLTPVPAWIDTVAHKTYLRVDEEGTEAAAVTSVGFGTVSAGPSTFRVDRPFLIVIREQLSGTVLFVGVIRDPR